MNHIIYIMSVMFSLVCMLALNGAFLIHFSQTDSLESKVASLHLENEKFLLEMEMQEIEMYEFKQEVAAVLPQFDNKPKNYQGRQLASVLGGYANLNMDGTFSRTLLRNAKNDYLAKDYKQASVKLHKYIERYPHSIHLPECYLMLINIEFNERRYEETINFIDHLVSAYPDNEITAHALMVLGEIMQRQERLEDASDLYKTIIDSFDIKQIRKNAKISLRAIGLD